MENFPISVENKKKNNYISHGFEAPVDESESNRSGSRLGDWYPVVEYLSRGRDDRVSAALIKLEAPRLFSRTRIALKRPIYKCVRV